MPPKRKAAETKGSAPSRRSARKGTDLTNDRDTTLSHYVAARRPNTRNHSKNDGSIVPVPEILPSRTSPEQDRYHNNNTVHRVLKKCASSDGENDNNNDGKIYGGEDVGKLPSIDWSNDNTNDKYDGHEDDNSSEYDGHDDDSKCEDNEGARNPASDYGRNDDNDDDANNEEVEGVGEDDFASMFTNGDDDGNALLQFLANDNNFANEEDDNVGTIIDNSWVWQISLFVFISNNVRRTDYISISSLFCSIQVLS